MLAPGVADVVQGMRHRKPGEKGGLEEFVIVWHDPAVVTADELEGKLRYSFLKEKLEPAAVSCGKARAVFDSPVGAPGDLFRITLEGFAAPPELVLPEGWAAVVISEREIVLKSPGVFVREDLKPYFIVVAAPEGEIRLPVELVDSPATQKARQKKGIRGRPPRPRER